MLDKLSSKQEQIEHPKWVSWFVPISIIATVYSTVVLALFLLGVINLNQFMVFGSIGAVFLAIFSVPTVVYFDEYEKLERLLAKR